MTLIKQKAKMLLTAIFFVNCFALSVPAAWADSEGIVLYVTLALGDPFYQMMIKGLDEEATKLPAGTKLEKRAGTTLDDVSGQRDIIDNYIRRHKSGRIKLKGVILVPASSGMELINSIRHLNQENIPVINVDIAVSATALDKSKATVSSFVGSDNVEGGRVAAKVMAEFLPKGGNVVILLGAPGQANTKARRDGFVEKITELDRQRGTQTNIVEWTANWSQSDAMVAVDSLIASGKTIDGIFAESDVMALGAGKSIKTHKVIKPTIIGYDAIPACIQDINSKEGIVTATISQNPDEMGREAVRLLMKIWSGESIPSKVVIPISVVRRKSAPE